MFSEVNAAQKHIIKNFGNNPSPGEYAVPYSTSRGEAFMKVTIDQNLGMSGFELWWDELFTNSWYTNNPDGSARY